LFRIEPGKLEEKVKKRRKERKNWEGKGSKVTTRVMAGNCLHLFLSGPNRILTAKSCKSGTGKAGRKKEIERQEGVGGDRGLQWLAKAAAATLFPARKRLKPTGR